MSATAVLVPSKNKTYHVFNGAARVFKSHQELEEFLVDDSSGIKQLLGVMGGPGQAMFIRAQQLGLSVMRIPWFTLRDATGIKAGASEEDRAAAVELVWGADPDAFYAATALDPRIYMMRELTRVRLAIQETYRKPAQLQYQAAFRDLEPLLPRQGKLALLRTTFAEPAMIEGAKQDEKELEAQIIRLTKALPIWDALHPGAGSALPRVKGLGPSLGGSLIGEIGDIRRFPSASHLRAYARFHVNAEGGFPRRRKGEVSNWNAYLNRAVWLWSTDQMPRYGDHIWRALYDWRKAVECELHPEPVQVSVGDKVVTKYTLGHLDRRAKRWVGSKLLEYVYGLWTALELGLDPETWYLQSAWPTYFADIQRELAEGKAAFLQAQIKARRKEVPAEEQD